MRPFRWGIFGTGAVAAKFVAGLAAARDAEVAWVASRSADRAQRFAAAVDAGRGIGGYAAAVAAGGVDAVYIATPPSEHPGHALACISAGLPVLVEKPLAASEADGRRIASAAREHGVFAMEAMWTRFLPAAQAMRSQVASGSVGEVRLVTGSFGSSEVPEPGNHKFDPELGGGAVAHLGVYPLSWGQWLFGTPELVGAAGTVSPTGVDEDAAFLLRYPGGVIGSFHASIRAWSSDELEVHATDGTIRLRGTIVRPHGLEVVHEPPQGRHELRLDWRERLRQHGLVHQVAQRLDRSSRRSGRREAHRYAGNGYHYEADEVRSCVEQGVTESSVMPLDDSVAILATADAIRAAIGVAANRSGGDG